MWHNPSFLHLRNQDEENVEVCSFISCTLYLQFFRLMFLFNWQLLSMFGRLNTGIQRIYSVICCSIGVHGFRTKGDDGWTADVSPHLLNVEDSLRGRCEWVRGKQLLNTGPMPKWFTYYKIRDRIQFSMIDEVIKKQRLKTSNKGLKKGANPSYVWVSVHLCETDLIWRYLRFQLNKKYNKRVEVTRRGFTCLLFFHYRRFCMMLRSFFNWPKRQQTVQYSILTRNR